MKFTLTTLAVTTAISFSAFAADNTLTVYTYDSLLRIGALVLPLKKHLKRSVVVM